MVGMETREKLVDLGEAAIRSRGYTGFSYADIARDAGIRKASIHHHFPTKADLGLAVLERYSSRLSEALRKIGKTHATAGANMLELIKFYRDACGEGDQLCLCVALSANIHAIDDAVHRRLSSTNQMTCDWIADLMSAGRKDGSINPVGNPANEATAVLALLQGAQLLARTTGDLDDFDRAVAPLATRIQAN